MISRAAAQGNRPGMDYRIFTCASQADGTAYHCHFLFLQTAISLRHSDTVDARFLVNGKRITVALPHPACVEYARQRGQALTDGLAATIAAHCLKENLEKGGAAEDLTVPVEGVLEMATKAEATAPQMLDPRGPTVPA